MKQAIAIFTCAAFTLAALPISSFAAAYQVAGPRRLPPPSKNGGSLGIATDPVADVQFNGRTLTSLHLIRFFPGSSLQGQGLKVGDRIISINHFLLPDKPTFVAILRALHPGEQASIGYVVQGTGEQREADATVIATNAVNDTPPPIPGQPDLNAPPSLDDYLAKAKDGDGLAAMSAAAMIGNHDDATIAANLDRIVPLWEIAARQGVPDGIAALGFLFYNGSGSYPRDRDQAFSLWQVAADKGSVIASRALADMDRREPMRQLPAEDHTVRNAAIGLAVFAGLIWLVSGSSSTASSGEGSSPRDPFENRRDPERPSAAEPSPSYIAPVGGETGLYGSSHGVGN